MLDRDISTYQTPEPECVTKIEWKVVFYEDVVLFPGVEEHTLPFFRLYLIVNNEIEYYAGSGFRPRSQLAINTTTGIRLDAPPNALSTLSSLWTGLSQQFYIYQKSDTELAVMHRAVDFMNSVHDEYEKILVIPIRKGTQILVSDYLIVQEPDRGKYGYG